MTKKYNPEQLAYLREGYKWMRLDDLTEAFNRQYCLNKTPGQIKSTLANHKMTSGRSTGSRQKRLLTQEQEYFLKAAYKNLSRAASTALLNETYKTNFTLQQITAYVKNNGIKSGRTGGFEKGHAPWNAGTKGVVKPNSGNFKKGQVPKNQKPVGHERVCKKDGYVLIKTDQINPYTGFRGWYRHKHLVMWEQVNGPVPDGFVVSFIDGNKANIDLLNLELIDRNHLCRMNKQRVYDLPNELIPTMKNVVRLKVQMHERSTHQAPGSEQYGQ